MRRLDLGEPGDLVGILGFGSPDWVVADLACLYLGAVSVPLQRGMAAADLAHILREGDIKTLFVSVEDLPSVHGAVDDAPSLKHLIAFDTGDRFDGLSVGEWFEGLPVVPLTDVIVAGERQGILAPADPGEGLATIVYTSGSTGFPKGAMFPLETWARYWRSTWIEESKNLPVVGVAYMPLNHMAGRLGVLHTLARGGVTNFVRESNLSTLFDDIRAIRPTELLLVPRVSNMVYQEFLAERARRFASTGEGDDAERTRAEAELKYEMGASFLGDRLLIIQVGSAPTAPAVVQFLEECFEVPVIDGYGSTEAGNIAVEGELVPENVLDYRVEDVPELGYRTTDQPLPRGELLLQTSLMVPGYFKNEAATRDLFDRNGFLRTGDIVEQASAGHVRWIDRRKNVIKLANGEFVAISRLEEAYVAASPLLQQMFLYAHSTWSFLLAVVVPDLEALKAASAHEGGNDPADALGARHVLRRELSRVARRDGRRAYEVPRDVLVEPVPFSVQNGLLTVSNKPSRQKLLAKYRPSLELLHQEVEEAQVQELSRSSAERGIPTATIVDQAIRATLGIPEADGSEGEATFAELGGDSLSAVVLRKQLEARTGVDVPVGVILEPTASISRLVRYVEAQRSAGPRADLYARVHGPNASVVRAADLQLEVFLGGVESLPTELGKPSVRPRTVLLTGANGFLGRFLAISLLEQLGDDGRVIALVRAPDDASAAARLRGAMGDTLWKRLHALAHGGRLMIRAGDLMKPAFGLPAEAYGSLRDEVDAVLHAGALVNHALSYGDLFDPNVLGTVEVMRLALHGRPKSIAFISSVGVAMGTGPRVVSEDMTAAEIAPEKPVDSGYAVGYGTSKWAGEVLLTALARRYGVLTSIFRCSLLLPPENTPGQVNAGDFLTRLLVGLITTGVAPASFYVGETAAVDGLPVDFVAGAIVHSALGAHEASVQPRPGTAPPNPTIYHVVNPDLQRGLTLDSLVDAIGGMGYPIQRVPNYGTWFDTFRGHLLQASAAERQRSPLAILSQWAAPVDAATPTRFLSSRFQGDLADSLPCLDASYARKYLGDMADAGLIPRAPVRHAAA